MKKETNHIISASRSKNMSAIKSKNTKPEVEVRKLLHSMGFRFRLHKKDLPGSPDIVLPKYKTVIFVHGCFWHRHQNCKYASNPKTRVDFWNKKFKDNIERDIKVRKELENLEWNCLIIWECQIKNKTYLKEKLRTFLI
tara:strand:+ start:184 stop:600 length:417 start_codon:yes stop_codon:yes gene_type:complete